MSEEKKELVDLVAELKANRDKKEKEAEEVLYWKGDFNDYLHMLKENPKVACDAFSRVHDMIISHGVSTYRVNRKEEKLRYHFFDDPFNGGEDAVYGIDDALMRFVKLLESAKNRFGIEKRILLLHGPVGSSKSTIARLLKRGLEDYSRSDQGKLFTFTWKGLEDEHANEDCPMHEDPLHLIPKKKRKEVLNSLGIDSSYVNLEGDLCPSCRRNYTDLMEKYKDWTEVFKHIEVKRLLLSEQDRKGIGTFQPKDEKNQDSTELTGDINYRKIALYGSDSDPRAFNFDGEFNIANRGMVEFIEVLKLETAFLYDLLGASQEKNVKPKKFPQTDIDELIIGHTNEAEYKKLTSNEFMEAFRDRTVKVDIPYITKVDDEIKIYEKRFTNDKVKGKHIAPHTIEMAALWAVLTRLEDPDNAGIDRVQKAKLYNGKSLPNFTTDNVKKLREDAEREGLDGISPRYIQDKISNALVKDDTCVNPFMVLRELEEGLHNHSLITDKNKKKEYMELIAAVKDEYTDIVKNEVQKAICADEEAINRMCAKYIDNLRAYTQGEKVKNKFTQQEEAPDERLMRSIEEKIGISEAKKKDFRMEIMNYIGAMAISGEKFDYRSNERLHRALELKLFEDSKDSIKINSMVSDVIDKETQKKIEVVKNRLVDKYGYCEECATDVLSYVASIFARGDA